MATTILSTDSSKIKSGLTTVFSEDPLVNIISAGDTSDPNKYIIKIHAYLPELATGSTPGASVAPGLPTISTGAGDEVARVFSIGYAVAADTSLYDLWEFKITYTYSGDSAQVVYVLYEPTYPFGVGPETPRGTVTTTGKG